jgi:hypothetical protein
MKGQHDTPQPLAEKMARRLFNGMQPSAGDRILYPGCGDAPFAAAVEKVCMGNDWPLPKGYGVDSDPDRLTGAYERSLEHATVEQGDFLSWESGDVEPFDYVIANPPYVPIEGLDEEEKADYRGRFQTAAGRFDLYFLFFEQALRLLVPGGRLSFITPEKWTYVASAGKLRGLFSSDSLHIEEIEHVPEDAFAGLITYPCITTIRKSERSETLVKLRDGTQHRTMLPESEDSWAAAVRGADLDHMATGVTLGDISLRISVGLATGRDGLFVTTRDEAPDKLRHVWLRPTVSGRQLKKNDSPRSDSVFICPYRDDGMLPDEDELGAYGEWAREHRETLESRYCVENGSRAWYAWHETPPMKELLRPKILFRDVADEPQFWPDYRGVIVPRHSVYYIVPHQGVSMDQLAGYLNGAQAREWMESHCQRAHNGYLRLQSSVLEDLPVPADLAPERQMSFA